MAHNMISNYQQMQVDTEEKIRVANEKLAEIDRIDNATKGLASSMEGLMTAARQGLSYLSGSWNGTGFSTATGRNLSWMTEINKVKSEKIDEMSEKAFIAKLYDPYSSLLLDAKDRKRALKFLEEEIQKRGGSIDLRFLDWNNPDDVAIYSTVTKLTLAYNIDPQKVETLTEHMGNMLARNEIYAIDFKDFTVLNKEMLAAVEKDSSNSLQLIQKKGWRKVTEENHQAISATGDIVMEAAYIAVISRFSTTKSQQTGGSVKGTGGAKTTTINGKTYTVKPGPKIGGSKFKIPEVNGIGSSVASSTGNVINTQRSVRHSTVTKNPGLKGKANTSVDIVDSNGNLKTRRWYGKDGKAIRDVDMTNHGNPSKHPEWPHEHNFKYNADGTLKER